MLLQLKKMCKEGAYWGKYVAYCIYGHVVVYETCLLWDHSVLRANDLKFFFYSPTGTVAGVYVGMEYGVEKVRGAKDWVCYKV